MAESQYIRPDVALANAQAGIDRPSASDNIISAMQTGMSWSDRQRQIENEKRQNAMKEQEFAMKQKQFGMEVDLYRRKANMEEIDKDLKYRSLVREFDANVQASKTYDELQAEMSDFHKEPNSFDDARLFNIRQKAFTLQGTKYEAQGKGILDWTANHGVMKENEETTKRTISFDKDVENAVGFFDEDSLKKRYGDYVDYTPVKLTGGRMGFKVQGVKPSYQQKAIQDIYSSLNEGKPVYDLMKDKDFASLFNLDEAVRNQFNEAIKQETKIKEIEAKYPKGSLPTNSLIQNDDGTFSRVDKDGKIRIYQVDEDGKFINIDNQRVQKSSNNSGFYDESENKVDAFYKSLGASSPSK